MKKNSLFLSLFILCFLFSSGQNSSVDSVSIRHDNKWHVQVYFMLTNSFNIGHKIYPYLYDNNTFGVYSYKDFKESSGIGYNIGFEIESKKILKKLSLGFGLYLERFYYTGTTQRRWWNNWPPAYVSDPALVTYFYKDYYINLPVLCHYILFNKKSNRLNALLGASVAYFLSEYNSRTHFENEYIDVWGVKKNRFTSSGIAGIDYYFGKKLLFNLGLRFSAQLIKTPTDRRLASIGIKAGFSF